MTKNKITVDCYAKINLFLEIENKRPDGYHNIQTIFQNISLHDSIQLEKWDKFDLKIQAVDFGKDLSPGDDNLIINAARIMQSHYPIIKGARIKLIKRIPIGGGLGGGSSDAAGILIALTKLYDVPISRNELHELSLFLGMDIPFFLQGGSAIASGRGDCLRSFTHNLNLGLVLVFPGFSISTQHAYAQYSLHKDAIKHQANIDKLKHAMESHNLNDFYLNLHNDFEIILAPQYPQIQEIKSDLLEKGCSAALLSGSGSVIYGIVEDLQKGEIIRKEMKGKYPFVNLAQTQQTGIKISDD